MAVRIPVSGGIRCAYHSLSENYGNLRRHRYWWKREGTTSLHFSNRMYFSFHDVLFG
jgi:hypothetical protein